MFEIPKHEATLAQPNEIWGVQDPTSGIGEEQVQSRVVHKSQNRISESTNCSTTPQQSSMCYDRNVSNQWPSIL